MFKTTGTKWSPAMRLLHWSIAVLVIGMLAYGVWMNHFAPRPDRSFYRLIHADIGYLIFLLMAMRLVWRSFYSAPPPPASSPAWVESRQLLLALYSEDITLLSHADMFVKPEGASLRPYPKG